MPICWKSTLPFSLTSLLVSQSFVGCAGQSPSTSSDSEPAASVRLALTKSGLPPCVAPLDGMVWYVWSSDEFVVCDGAARSWTPTGSAGYSAAIDVVPLDAGTECTAGGVTVQFGLDLDRDGELDPQELSSEASVCSGADGAAGATGPSGAQGATGAPGPQGATGATGPEGHRARSRPEPTGTAAPGPMLPFPAVFAVRLPLAPPIDVACYTTSSITNSGTGIGDVFYVGGPGYSSNCQ